MSPKPVIVDAPELRLDPQEVFPLEAQLVTLAPQAGGQEFRPWDEILIVLGALWAGAAFRFDLANDNFKLCLLRSRVFRSPLAARRLLPTRALPNS